MNTTIFILGPNPRGSGTFDKNKSLRFLFSFSQMTISYDSLILGICATSYTFYYTILMFGIKQGRIGKAVPKFVV